MKYSRIEGHENLLRDLRTGAVINVDHASYESYLHQKKLKEREANRINNLEYEVSSLKNDLSEIKSLLQELVNGSK